MHGYIIIIMNNIDFSIGKKIVYIRWKMTNSVMPKTYN